MEDILDYDSHNDLWTQKGTKTPFTGMHERYEKCSEENEDALCRMTGYIENGQWTGIWKVYNVDDKICAELTFSKNQLHGPFKGYHPNGKVHSTGSYKNGKRDGLLTWFNEDGTIERKEKWIEDELVN